MNGTGIDIRTWAEIDLSALLHNFRYAKECAQNRPVMCVIKANAYGHGAVECGRHLEKNGADAFAVACLDEAIKLREGGITLPILVLGYTPAQYTELIAKYDLTQTLVDLEHAKAVSKKAKECGVTVKAHIKLDTGMSRTGILAQGEHFIKSAIEEAVQECELPNIDVTGMYTHMSVADTPGQKRYTSWQISNFNGVRDGLIARGHDIKYCHMSNSAGILNHPETHFDMVREGVILYGMYPDSLPVINGPLRPVMTLKSRVAQVRHLPKATTISYGRTYTAEKDMVSAVILAGYADGYPRRMSNQAHLTIGGKQYRQIGNVCMDMMMADVSGSDVKRDDEVILFGKGGVSIESLSRIVGTINYELTCQITPRVKRKYING